MRLITRCPECTTLFRVVPDQLKISDGWVRCGRCHAVFEAALHFADIPETQDPGVGDAAREVLAAPVEASSGIVAVQAEPAGARQDDGPPAQASAGSEHVSGVPHAPPDGSSFVEGGPVVDPTPPAGFADVEPTPVEAQVAQTSDLSHGELGVPVSSAPAEELAVPETGLTDVEPAEPAGPEEGLPTPVVDQTVAAEPETGADAKHPLAKAPSARAVESGSPSFVRQAQRRAFWQRRPVRWTLRLLAFLGIGALLLQVGWHQRDRLAAHWPASQPLLAGLCQAMGCRVEPLRQIESVVIESSSFNKIKAQVFRLNVAMRNTSAVAVAMPALELSLTDTQDQPVIRRVLLPQEFPGAAGTLPASGEWSGALALGVDDTSLVGRIIGYRVLAFYP